MMIQFVLFVTTNELQSFTSPSRSSVPSRFSTSQSPSLTSSTVSLSPASTYLPYLLLNLQIQQFRKGDRPAYAIITGPTSGIGKAYAFALAKNGFNLILVGRSIPKLNAVQEELDARYPDLDIRLVDIDLGKSSPRQYEEYVSALKDIPGDIRVLINNAGLSHAMPITFEDTSETEMENILGVNTSGVLRVTKHTLPFMLKTRYDSLSSLH
jgi:short chain dehydrogenase